MKITLHTNEPVPLNESVSTSRSSIIPADAYFQKSVEIPGIFNLSSISRFTFNRPPIQKLKSELIPHTITYKEVKELAGKSKKQLKNKNPNELEPFIKRLYQLKLSALKGLENAFTGNTKMIHIINSIKKQYE